MIVWFGEYAKYYRIVENDITTELLSKLYRNNSIYYCNRHSIAKKLLKFII